MILRVILGQKRFSLTAAFWLNTNCNLDIGVYRNGILKSKFLR